MILTVISYERKNGDLYLKRKEVNDTIYQVSGKDLIPYVIFDMGKYKLPVEYEAWYSYGDHYKYGKHYCSVITVGEDNRYLFLMPLYSALKPPMA